MKVPTDEIVQIKQWIYLDVIASNRLIIGACE